MVLQRTSYGRAMAEKEEMRQGWKMVLELRTERDFFRLRRERP